MSAYRMVDTTFYQPTTQPVPGAPAQGEWVNGEPVPVLQYRGCFRRMEAKLVDSPLGQVERQWFRWRGHLPDGFRPECGWQLEVDGRRYCIVAVGSEEGGVLKLDLERI